MPGDGPKVLWHSIRVDGLFAVYCFGGIETNPTETFQMPNFFGI